jgi:hypothetical protein
LLKKPKKVKIKSKKSAKAKIKETCGDMLETNKIPKIYVATIGCFLLVKGMNKACVDIDLKHVQIRRCAPLERWRIPIWGSQPLERWCTHTFLFVHTWHYFGLMERWQPLPQHLAALLFHLVRPSPTHGAPSLIGTPHHLLYIEAYSPIAFNWSLGIIACCNIDICNNLCNCGIKEDFGGQIGGLSKCVDAYVYEVILFYFSCFCIVVDLAL